MTSPHEETSNPTERDDIEWALNAVAQRAENLEAYATALLDDDGELDFPDAHLRQPVGSITTWEEAIAVLEATEPATVVDNADDIDLRQRLSPELLTRYETWVNARPQPWTLDDAVMVGAAIVLGAAMQTLDDTVDSAVLQGLQWLRQTEVMQGWEKLGKRLPIDYTGRKFGGPDHRQRSPGHDLLRLAEGLRQIRGGYFQGVYWDNGIKRTFITAPGSYLPVDNPVEAMTRLLAHLAADFVTPLSLPLPGWTLLGSLPERHLRVLAAELYRGGYNARSGVLSPGLGVVLVEVLLRVHLSMQAYASRGSLVLEPSETAKANELLLVAHSGLAASSASTAAARALTGEGALALRHLNAPAFARAGVAAVVVISNRAQVRRLEPTSWFELAEEAIAANTGGASPGFSDSLAPT